VDGGVSTGNVADLVIAFKDAPLKALNPTAFATLFAGVTLRPSVDVEIQGKADVIVRTPIGDIAISGIALDVQSQLTGPFSELSDWRLLIYLQVSAPLEVRRLLARSS